MVSDNYSLPCFFLDVCFDRPSSRRLIQYVSSCIRFSHTIIMYYFRRLFVCVRVCDCEGVKMLVCNQWILSNMAQLTELFFFSLLEESRKLNRYVCASAII